MCTIPGTSPGAPITLVDALESQAAAQPAHLAYVFLANGESEEQRLTYAALRSRVRTVAAQLQALGLAGQRAILLFEPGLDYVTGFLGCLWAGVIAVPAYPPDPLRMERTFSRFQGIVADARPAAILATGMILELAGYLLDEHAGFRGVHRIATDALPETLAETWRDPGVARDTLAFLQYTSGSTSEPKGVMLTHGNLVHNLGLIYDAFEIGPDSLGVIWLPPYHDMGLIGGILQPLYAGRPAVLMSPLTFLQHPFRWLSAVSNYRATHSGGPNFAYDLCVRKVTAAQKASLDLSHWRVAFTGAEPVRAATIERFCAAFAGCGFRREAFHPCYGLAEATLLVSGGKAAEPPRCRTVDAASLEHGRVALRDPDAPASVTLVGCGETLDGQEIAIVDPEAGTPCAADRVGEIWVAGDSVAQGYWGRPAETTETFRARLPGRERDFLRTGDLGFLLDGELYVTGRIKDLIIIDGRNHYPQDIELTVEGAHPAIRPGCTAAFPITVENQERLVVAAEVKPAATDTADACRTLDSASVVTAIRRAIAQNHDLDVYAVALLRAGGALKTSSGKIQRRASRAAYLAGALNLWNP